MDSRSNIPNREPGKGKASRKENHSRPQKAVENRASKKPRTVLGSITNNARVQPPRAAKFLGDARQEENLQNVFGKSSNQPFSIYVDQDPPLVSQGPVAAAAERPEDDIENDVPVLPDDVAGLPSISQPVALPSTSQPICLPSTSQPSGPEGEAGALEMSGVEEDEDQGEDENQVEDEEQNEEQDEADISMEQPALPVQRREPEVSETDVAEYGQDIYAYLLSIECKHKPRQGFMKRQQEVTLAMRSILIDWLVEVAEEYRLQRETLFLTVSLIDRFLARMSVLRSKLQLVGASAMFLAAKYEEIYPPDVNEFVYITDDTYQRRQILRMEVVLLKMLNYEMGTPTINWFCERLLRAMDADSVLSNFTMYLCELVLVDYENFLEFPSSVVAASAVCLARYTLSAPVVWPSECVKLTSYSVHKLVPCVEMMYHMHRNIQIHPQQAVTEKYRLEKYMKVANLPAQPALYIQ